jgi:hypothetical protein
MIDREINNGMTELQNIKIENMTVAKYYKIQKEYSEIVSDTRKINKKELAQNGEKAELNLYYSIRYNLNKLVLEKLTEVNHEEL